MVARQSGPMKMNHACRLTDELCTRMHEWRLKKWRRIVRISGVPVLSPSDFGRSWGIWRNASKQGSDGNPLRLKVCVRSTYEAGLIRNRRVVPKLQRGVKVSVIHSGFRVVRLIQLNLLSFLPGTLSDAWSTCVWIACVFWCFAADYKCSQNALSRRARPVQQLVFAMCVWVQNFFHIPAYWK